MGKRFLTILVTSLLLYQSNACSDEIYLKNKDRITGEIIEETDENFSVKTEAMGVIPVKKDFVEHIVKEKKVSEEKESKEIVWKREISAGYNTSRGNTRNEQFSLSAFLNRNQKHIDEITLKGNMYYSSSNKRMDAQKWYTMGRYAFSFGKTKKWYNFYRVESDHDRFANIHYRIIPAAGIGYWFFDDLDVKLLAEGAVGLEYMDYRNDTKDVSEIVLVPRIFFEKRILGDAIISQNLLYYPTVRDFNNYRIYSETLLTISLNEKFAVRLSLIDDYDSEPAQDTEKNDIRFESSLVYEY